MSRRDVDKRDWKKYNESLVMRGEILLDFDKIEDWERRLREMNEG